MLLESQNPCIHYSYIEESLLQRFYMNVVALILINSLWSANYLETSTQFMVHSNEAFASDLLEYVSSLLHTYYYM